MDIVTQWIRKGLEKPGRSGRGLAAVLRIDPSGVTRMLKGERKLRLDEVQKVADYLGVEPPPEVFADSLPPLPPKPAALPNVDMRSLQTEGLFGKPDLPVYASAMGGAGEMIMNYEPIEYVKRPSVLENVPGGFAMYVVGDSMAPRFKPGELLLIHPKRIASAGDEVLVVKVNGRTGEHEAMVKELLSRDQNVYRLKQHNPNRQFEIPVAEVQGCYLILGLYTKHH